MRVFCCFMCGKTSSIPATCWHETSNGKEFAVKMRESREFEEPKKPEKKYVMAKECLT